MSIELEQSFIGGLMVLGDMNTELAGEALALVQSGFFTDEQHSIIYTLIQRLAVSGEPVDPVTLSEEAEKIDKGHFVQLEYLAQLAAETPSAANIVSYGHKIREKAVQRTIVDKLYESIKLINDPKAGTIQEKMGEIEGMIGQAGDFAETGKEIGLRPAGEIAKEWLTDLQDRMENNIPAGFTTGIKSLDDILAPKMIPAGSLVLVGARPKTGKTALLTTIVNHFGIDRVEDTAVFSLEMSDKQMIERMVAGAGKFNTGDLYNNDHDHWASLSAGVQAVQNSKVYIDDSPNTGLAGIVRQCRKLAKKEGSNLKLIAVDYLTLMKTEKAERNDLKYSAITRGLKGLAKELDCVVLLITQLNRQLEQRPNKRPLPSDSRDSGAVEADADLWIGLYRPSMYEEDTTHSIGFLEIIIKLNRHGEVGTAYGEVKHGVVQQCSDTPAQ